MGVIHAAIEMDIRVPDDLSVLGYDDLPIANYIVPALTTIAQPLLEMGQTAANLLIQSIDSPYFEPQKAVLPTHLVVRHSTQALQKSTRHSSNR